LALRGTLSYERGKKRRRRRRREKERKSAASSPVPIERYVLLTRSQYYFTLVNARLFLSEGLARCAPGPLSLSLPPDGENGEKKAGDYVATLII
jgi:hypothetical protein